MKIKGNDCDDWAVGLKFIFVLVKKLTKNFYLTITNTNHLRIFTMAISFKLNAKKDWGLVMND